MSPRMTEENTRLAVLIDADNTSPKRTREMFEELASYGTLTVKRAYGDWTDQRLSGWKGELHRHAISPMQQFANTSGKNATDSALIIDAMDLLYAGNVDGFVIVSSDADFTKLATRLRESGMTVYGLGQRKTPKPFVEACDKFIYLEVLGTNGADAETDGESTDDAGSREPDGALHSLITRSVNKSPQDDEDWTQLSTLANLLNRSDPSFDPRTYGKAKLSDLVRSLHYLETKSMPGPSGRSELWVRLKGQSAKKPAADKGASEKGAAEKAVPEKKPARKTTKKATSKSGSGRGGSKKSDAAQG
jgi:uncharacterized LabA/DUF88 family protein